MKIFASFRMDYYSSDFIDPVSGKMFAGYGKEALHVCRSFVDSFGSKFQNLLIYGNPESEDLSDPLYCQRADGSYSLGDLRDVLPAL